MAFLSGGREVVINLIEHLYVENQCFRNTGYSFLERGAGKRQLAGSLNQPETSMAQVGGGGRQGDHQGGGGY